MAENGLLLFIGHNELSASSFCMISRYYDEKATHEYFSKTKITIHVMDNIHVTRTCILGHHIMYMED
jgi:hypothetical protein